VDVAGDLAKMNYLQRRPVRVGDQGQDLTDIGRRKQHRVREILGGHVEQNLAPAAMVILFDTILRYILIFHDTSPISMQPVWPDLRTVKPSSKDSAAWPQQDKQNNSENSYN
jgi:hypothetical protein